MSELGFRAPPPPVWDARPVRALIVCAYGGFWIRFVAYIIDGIVLAIACGIVAVIAPATHVSEPRDLDALRSDRQPESRL